MYHDRERFPFPDGVISDMHLGLDSAIDLLKWLKTTKELQTIPLFILTGTASTQECADAKDLGAMDVVRKPAKYEDLRTMIRDLAVKLCI